MASPAVWQWNSQKSLYKILSSKGCVSLGGKVPTRLVSICREGEAAGGAADQVQGLDQDQQAEDLGPRRDEPESLGADDRAGGGVRGA